MRTTNAAKLPALPRVSTGNPALDQWVQAVTERLEVREGSRGNPNERAVTVREMRDLGLSGFGGVAAGNNQPGNVLTVNPDGTYSTITPGDFAESIRKSKLYKDLMTRIDDATRFDGLPEQVKAVLLDDLAAEAAKRGAEIRRLEHKLQSATESLAYAVEEVTASVTGSMAGVRETVFAATTESNATAGKVTQLVAALDGTGSATIEDSLVVIADRTAGLSAQYMLKLTAGGAVAGIGLMATEDPTGATESSFIVQSDKFAIVTPGFASKVPFGVDANGAYATGLTIKDKAGNVIMQAGASLATSTLTLPGTVSGVPSGWLNSNVSPASIGAAGSGNPITAANASTFFSGAGAIPAVYIANLAASQIVAGTLTGFTMQTGASGARYVITGTSFQGYNASNVLVSTLDMASGTALFTSSSLNAVVGKNTGSGSGVNGESQGAGTGVVGITVTGRGVSGTATGTGVGVEGISTSYIGGAFYGGSNAPPLYINPNGSLPTSGAIHGSLCCVGGLLYFHNGSTWKQVSLL